MTDIATTPTVLRARNGSLRHSLPDIGWGFIVAWGLATVFTPVFSAGDTANMGVFWLASMIGAPVGLFSLFLLPVSLTTTRARTLAFLGAVASMTLGVALLTVSPSMASDVGVHALQAAGGFVSAVGTAVFTVLWGAHYASLDMTRIERMATASLIAAFACYAVVLVLPRLPAILFVGCLPFLSAFCLAAAHSGNESAPCVRNRKDAQRLGHLNVPGFVRLGLGIVGATTVVSLFWTFANDDIVPAAAGVLTTSVLSGSVVAVLITAYLSRFSRALNLGTLYRWVLPLIAVAFSLLVLPIPGAIMGAAFLVNAAQALLNLTTFIYFAELSQRTGASAQRVFGLGRFFLEGGFLVGLLLGPPAASWAAETSFYQGVLFVALTGFIVLAMVSIANQDRLAFTLEETGRDCSASSAPTQSAASAPSSQPDETAMPAEDASADRFALACAAAADEFGLTKREREILPYLAQGYSLPYIRNELYISQSTIDTHVRHIYKKMGLHSKEELITAVRGRC